jgi:hypothetical protein
MESLQKEAKKLLMRNLRVKTVKKVTMRKMNSRETIAAVTVTAQKM